MSSAALDWIAKQTTFWQKVGKRWDAGGKIDTENAVVREQKNRKKIFRTVPNRKRPSILTREAVNAKHMKQVEKTPFRAECGRLIGRHASYPNCATITTRGSGAAHRSILTAHVAPSITKDQKRER
jgi:hypothetical protein